MLAVMVLLMAVQEGEPPITPEPATPEGIELSLRFAWAGLDVRTYAQEFDTGKFSGTLDLHDDLGTPSSAPVARLDAIAPGWRAAFTIVDLAGRVTTEDVLIFEDPVWPAGTSLRTHFSAFWLDAMAAFPMETEDLSVSLLAGIHFTRLKFLIEGGGDTGNEGHPALLLPLPQVGAAARWNLLPQLRFDAELLLCYAKYTHPFHKDGDDDARIEYSYASLRASLSWQIAPSWSVSVGGSFVRHRLRDSCTEDRHRAWVNGDGIEIAVTFEF